LTVTSGIVHLRRETTIRCDVQLASRPKLIAEQRLAAGDMEGGARLFFETIAFGPGAWEQLPEQSRRTFVANAPVFLAEMRDPEQLRIELGGGSPASRIRRSSPTATPRTPSSPPWSHGSLR
jgi:hypothetical protein